LEKSGEAFCEMIGEVMILDLRFKIKKLLLNLEGFISALRFSLLGSCFLTLVSKTLYLMSIPKNIINLGIQIVPKSKTLDTYALVDKAIAVIQESGVKYEVTPFETVMEGPQDKLMTIAMKAQEAVLEAGADEILVYYRLHVRKNNDVTMFEKTDKFKSK
jgi:uncharacterized protein YqgV (UPF0045/DUF77 family)